MASRRTILLLLVPLVSMSLLLGSSSAQLSTDYYHKTCPKVEEIVRHEMEIIIEEAESLAAAFLRLHFHDCFVRGCDASVLLNSTYYNTAERDASPNLSLRGFGSVDRVKALLEAKCPNTVSCADVLALMARDAVELIGGPKWNVSLGRRDGRESNAYETKDLPPPSANLTKLMQMFGAKGLDLKDLVVLSGGHTIGITSCKSVNHRLYNFTGKNNIYDSDPFMKSSYKQKLREKCPNAFSTTPVEIDSGSRKTFDTSYYKHVLELKSTFLSDWALLTDNFTRGYVERIASGTLEAQNEFFEDYAESIVKMGSIGVLTGTQGEIRKKCYIVNP